MPSARFSWCSGASHYGNLRPWVKGQVDLECQTADVVLWFGGFLGIQGGDVVAS